MYHDLDEQSLARLCSEGNRLAEDELYRRYAARVMTLCRRYTDNLDDAKDLMQDAMIKALDKIRTYRYSGKGSLYGWISRIAINMVLNQLRRKRWLTVPLDSFARDTIPEPDGDEVGTIPQEVLLGLISSLPEMRRAVFNLYCIEGYSHREIGKMLGISEKGSSGMLAKARKELKDKINGYLKGTPK